MKGVITGLRLFRAGWILCALFAVAPTTSAQETFDAKQIVGKWVGTIQAVGLPPSPVEVEFKPDGAFEGQSRTARFGPVSYAGRWKTEGTVILVEYTARSSQGSSEVAWTLEQDGKVLGGTGFNKTIQNPFGVSLARGK